MTCGTTSAYSAGCRCAECRAAIAAYRRETVARRRAEAEANGGKHPTAPTHGRESTYNNWGCRCDECTEAHTVYCCGRKLARTTMAPPADAHGRYATYTNWGCRCEPCTAASAAYKRERRRKAKAMG